MDNNTIYIEKDAEGRFETTAKTGKHTWGINTENRERAIECITNSLRLVEALGEDRAYELEQLGRSFDNYKEGEFDKYQSIKTNYKIINK